MVHILVVGNPVYSRIETPQLAPGPRTLSGCATNACLGIARLGSRATLIGAISDDFAPDFLAVLGQEGVTVTRCPSTATGGFHIRYDTVGTRTLRPIALADAIPPSVMLPARVDGVIIGPIFNEVSVELVRAVRRATQAPLLLDPQGLLRTIESGQVCLARTAAFDAIASLVDIIKVSEDEAHVITGIDPRDDPVAAAHALHALGGKLSIVTLAERGSVIVDGNTVYRIPAFRSDVVDPTGAGDLYASGWMLQYVENPEDLVSAGVVATAMASLMVEHRGPGFPMSISVVKQRAAALRIDVITQG